MHEDQRSGEVTVAVEEQILNAVTVISSPTNCLSEVQAMLCWVTGRTLHPDSDSTSNLSPIVAFIDRAVSNNTLSGGSVIKNKS